MKLISQILYEDFSCYILYLIGSVREKRQISRFGTVLAYRIPDSTSVGSVLHSIPIKSVRNTLKDRTVVKKPGPIPNRTSFGSVSIYGSKPVRTDRMPT